MAMLHHLKGPITEERISKLSKRKRKRHRVGEFQQLCFMFIIPIEDLDWNNKILDLIVDYCEENNLFVVGWTGHKGVSGTILHEKGNSTITQKQLDDFKIFIKSQNIKIYCTKLIDLWYDEELMDKWYDSFLETKMALLETEE